MTLEEKLTLIRLLTIASHDQKENPIAKFIFIQAREILKLNLQDKKLDTLE